MLINFRFKNARSFYNETIFSMEATKDKTLGEFNTFTPKDNRLLSSKCDLLKSALIFGPNASGKSNIFKALNYMRYFVLNSSSSFLLKPIDYNRPFAFYECAKTEDSLYEVEIVANDKYYKYGFIINSGKVVSEWLETKEERKKSIFKREGKHVYINKPSSRKIDFVAINDTTLFLSIGASFNSPITNDILNVIGWFQRLKIISSDEVKSLNLYKENRNYQKMALDILQRVDTGIKNIQVKEVKINGLEVDEKEFLYQNENNLNTYSRMLRDDSEEGDLDLVTSYDVYKSKENHTVVNKKDVALYKNPDFNSKGTERLLNFLGYVLESLEKGEVIFIDQIDSPLHFFASDYLISMYNSIDKNPNNAQLIATALNTSLMDKGLRRDQIYFTSKDNDGVSSLCCLSDFKDVRKSEVYSKKYLAGFYTKLPDFNRGL